MPKIQKHTKLALRMDFLRFWGRFYCIDVYVFHSHWIFSFMYVLLIMYVYVLYVMNDIYKYQV